MNNCPQCAQPLVSDHDQYGLFQRCPTCHGRLISLAALRKIISAEAVNKLWQEVQNQQSPAGRPCPECGLLLREVRSTIDGTPMAVDVCPCCILLWFDTGEFERLLQIAPPLSAPLSPSRPKLSEETSERLAMVQLEMLAARHRLNTRNDPPDSWWKVILALFGFPVEVEDPTTCSFPWATLVLAALIAVIASAVLLKAPAAVQQYGFIPAQWWRYGGLTLITAFFLHANFLHLIGNLYFFVVFGNNVEGYLGRGRFLLLLLLSTLFGCFVHALGNPSSTLPCIGASGGIAGVMACYACAFPQARFAMLIWVRWVQIPAFVLIIFWVMLQSLQVWLGCAGLVNISVLAHLGGVAAGVICWLFWHDSAEAKSGKNALNLPSAGNRFFATLRLCAFA